MAETLRNLILLILVGEYAFSRVLAYLNQRAWASPIPDELKSHYTDESHQRARSYSRDKYQVAWLTTTISLLIALAFLLGGGYAWADAIARTSSGHYILQGLIFWAIVGGITMAIDLPFEWYSTFVVEQRYGFNKTSIQTFLMDKVKGIALAAVFGGGLYALLAWLYAVLGTSFWVAGWVTVSVVLVFISAFYTSLLLPLFNTLSPLEAGTLRSAIEEYAGRVSFPLTNILLMDGSKRSSKANAFFSGLGRSKTIVLYDTLVNEMTTGEVVSVLAHEVGHYQHKHTRSTMIWSVVQIGFMFLLFGWIARQPYMAQALGASENSFYLSLITFSMLYSPVSILLGIGMNILSRRYEYQADAYAAQTYNKTDMVSALEKLYITQLDQPVPHPAYVFVNYSHPTLIERIRALSRK